METDPKIQAIVDKLKEGMPFGLFDEGQKCYFEDGERVSYSDLWAAVKLLCNVQPSEPTRTLHELVPDIYEGFFMYGYHKHKWTKNRQAK